MWKIPQVGRPMIQSLKSYNEVKTVAHFSWEPWCPSLANWNQRKRKQNIHLWHLKQSERIYVWTIMVSIDSCEAAVTGLSHPMLATARISKSSGAKICNFWILRILGSSRFTVSDHPMTLVLPVMAIRCGTLVRLWRLTKSRHWTGCDWEIWRDWRDLWQTSQESQQ